MSKQKLIIHLVTLPRWFALPFFGVTALIGSTLAGGSLGEFNTWLSFIVVALLMASAHAANSFWDYHAGLDIAEEGSVGKGYTAGCRPIPDGLVTPKEVILNSIGYAIAGLIVCSILASRITPWVFVPAVLALAVPYFYTKGKFSIYHETVMSIGIVLAVVMGMFAVNTSPEWWKGIIITLPIAMFFGLGGLPLDEYPDAAANIKRGAKSISFKIWEYKVDLITYLFVWFVAIYIFQVFLIATSFLKPLTMLTFILFPILSNQLVLLKPAADSWRESLSNKALIIFSKKAAIIVMTMAIYPILILIGEIFG